MYGRHVNRTIQAYTSQAIEGWKAEVEQNPRDIAQYQLDIQEHLKQLALYNPKRHELLTQHIMPLLARIEAVESQIKVLTIPGSINELNLQISRHQNRLAELQLQLDNVNQVIAPIDVDINRLNIFIELRESQAAAAALTAEIAHNQHAIASHHQELHGLRHQLSGVMGQIGSANARLSALQAQQAIDSTAHMVHAFDHHHHGHHGYHGGYGSFVHNVGDMAVGMNIAALQSELRDLDRQHHSLSSAIHGLEIKIAGHQRDQDTAQRRLQEYQRRIAQLEPQAAGCSFTDNVSLLKADLALRQDARRPHEALRRQLDAEIQNHNHDIHRLRTNIQQSEAEYQRSLTLAGEFAANHNLDDLHFQLRGFQAVRSDLVNEQARLDGLIEGHRQGITKAQNGIDTKTQRQQELLRNQYMLKLRDQPGLLVNELADQVHARFTDYEKVHPANQAENIRICLAETIGKLGVILALPAADAVEARNKYYQLCGMLWEMLDKADGGENLVLADEMMAIFRCHPIDPEEAKAAFQGLKKMHSDALRDMTPADLVYMQYAQYDAAYQYLHDTLAAIPENSAKPWADMCSRGNDVMIAVNVRKLKAVDSGDPGFDIKYYTSVLHKTADLARDPGNQQLQQDYRNLVDHNKDGKPSLAKKICGAMLMFLGAAIVVASVALKVLSVGVAAPLTFAGMAGGGVLVAAGFGLFCWGVQKGTSRKMANFEKSVVRAGAVPLFKPAAPIVSGKSKLRSSDIDDETTMLKAALATK